MEWRWQEGLQCMSKHASAMGGQRADMAKARQLISKCLLACIGRALFISQTTSNLASFL
jgi:hypothetical protein